MLPWIILLSPLIAAALVFLVTRGSARVSMAVSLAGTAVSFVCSVLLFGSWEGTAFPAFTWLAAGTTFAVDIGLLVDELSAAMLMKVTGIGLLVQIFSVAYMREDDARWRYFAGISFFLFSMLGIVLADNLVMMFLFWELVGFSSYLLIGHWWRRPAAAEASKKAFITNRVGDFGFLAGILLIWSATGSFTFSEMREAAAGFNPGDAVVTTAILLIFCGAIGKSAQFPLHVWLPDAMEGPTPVSALIHAATMVAAGVYMMVRVDFLVALSPTAQTTIAVVGLVTLVLAALMAIQQNDIKKVLAYSTISQLGYMILAVGVLASTAAMFHLFTHAFFKALLFLGAGSVITAMHHGQDIWKMGGLKNKLPITFLTFSVATLAISGFPGFSGFFSKDAILAYAYEARPLYFWLAWGTAVLTAFYMTRLFVVVFLGKPLSDEARKAGESPPAMTAPLIILAVLSLIGGYSFFMDWFYKAPGHHDHLPGWFLPVAVSAFFLGTAAGFLLYRGRSKDPLLIPLFKNTFYIDTFYGWLVRRVQGGLATALAWIDKWILDGLLVRGVSGLTWGTGYVLRFIQIGSLQVYAFLFGLGIIILFSLTLFR